VKPSSATPLTLRRAAELWHEAELPAGVVNVITGPGERVGEALILHPLIKKVAVTGSLEAGKRIYELASKNIKRIGLELGGHSPAIVFADANLDIAVDALIFQGFRNAGEVCNRVNRIYMEESIAEELNRRLVEKAEKIVVGNGLEEGVDMGPLLAERFFDKVHGQVVDAKEKGARILTGGQRLQGEKYAKGFFYPPTLVKDVNHQMRLMQEETFGPVIGIMTFADEDQAVRLANDTVYGLSAFVFSQDLKRAWRVMQQLEAGSVWINDIHGSYVQCPYGGVKESGLGREQSAKAVEEYLEEKTVYLDLAKNSRGGHLIAH
jgi:succinate-semialdehyde dehydrogenase/glutarate-semialdehyde dehydrogenase